MELLGFPLCNYFDLVNENLKPHILAMDMKGHVNRKVLLYGKLVNTRFHKGANGKLMRFCTFVDIKGSYFDTVHFHDTVDRYPIHGIGVYECMGKVIEVIATRKLTLKPDPRMN